MTIPFSPTLDLASYVGQRSATFVFRLLDGVTGENLGEIHPLRDSPPTLTHDTNRTVKRTLSPVNLGVDDSALIDPIRQRVDVAMLIKGVEYPLGRYMFSDVTRIQWTSGELASCSLVDEMFIIDQEMTDGFAADTAGSETVEEAIRRLLADFTGVTIHLEPSNLEAAGSWTAGTSRAKVLGDLATQGGYFQPWFDNNGVLRIVRSFDPADAIPTLDFDAGNQVVRGSIANTDDLLSAPNRFVVISNATRSSAANLPAVGVYDVPSSAPHSIANRGFVVPDVRDMQLRDSLQAQAVAEAIGIAQTIFERVELSTPPDPRHDSYDVIRWQGEQWLELSWSMTLTEGGDMHHVLRKAYS